MGINYLSGLYLGPALEEEHFLEQYFTDSQFFSHFFLQENGRWQTGQIFSGKNSFFMRSIALLRIYK